MLGYNMVTAPTHSERDRFLVTRIIAASAAAVLLRAVLDVSYVTYVYPHFGAFSSAGLFPSLAISGSRMAESYIVTLLLSLWLSFSLYRQWRPSGIALVLYFTVVILPLSSLYGLTGLSPAFVYAVAASFSLLLIMTGVLPRVKVPRPSRVFVLMGTTLLIGMSVYVYGTLLLMGGVERLSFNLLSVYEVRAEFVQSMGPLMGYFVPWQATVANILVLCYGLNRRNPWLIGISCIAQLAVFGMTGQKSFLLAPVLASGVYFVWHRRNTLSYTFGGLVLVVVGAYLVFLASGNHLPPSLFVRRLFFVPAANHLIYYDFFSQTGHPLVMLSNSFLAPFIRFPYEMPITRVIAWAYWGRDFSPNVGYLGDAYAHFGFMGMFLFSMVLGFVLHTLDSVGRRLPPHLVAAVAAMPSMALVNSALFTSLFTHGLILTVVVVWLLRAVMEGPRRPRQSSLELNSIR
jgi:oligosaccharide repeat unit polymerase